MPRPALRRSGMTKHHGHHASHAPANHAFSLHALHAAASGPTPRRMTREPQQIEVTLEARETQWERHDWLINGETHHQDAPVKAGELQIWHIVNETGLDHPFHLHGFFFQVVAIDGVRVDPHSWEDTVNVRGKGTVMLAWRADARPGQWMYHCHILEHHAAGMMGHFEVVL
jgi:FtsP/CotA-like multicopper oxidase with cupredoxin domain